MNRNRVQHVIYPNPPFAVNPEHEHANQNQQVPYQPAFATAEERTDVQARDRRAQRAIWSAKLRLLEASKLIIQNRIAEMGFTLMEEYTKLIEEPSDLGAGYAACE